MLERGAYDQWEMRWSDARVTSLRFLFVTTDFISHQMSPEEHDAKHAWSRLNMGLFWALYTTSHLRRRIYSQIGIWYKSNWSLNVTVVEIVRGNHM